MADNHPFEEQAPPPHWRRNFIANFVDMTLFVTALAFGSFTTILPLFIRELGGSTLLVGLIPAISQTGFLLPPLFVAPYIGRLRWKLPYVLRMTFGERIPWPILALAAVFLAQDHPGLVIALTVVSLAAFGLMGGFTMPAWMDLITAVTPMRMRGQLFGWSSASPNGSSRTIPFRLTLRSASGALRSRSRSPMPRSSLSASPPVRALWSA
jgi:hypothetical protein